MMKRLAGTSVLARASVWMVAAGLPLLTISSAWAQGSTTFGPDPASQKNKSRAAKEVPLSDRLPDKPSLPPSWTIPVEPLGFSAPGAIYLGQRDSMVSLDFIDEDHLLFTFRVPGLIHRELEPGESAEGDERRIRAVVLALPDGLVQAEALWAVHDRARYLWMLKDGHFLLRDKDELEQGDATLGLKPLLRFPGPLLWVQLDPAQQFLVTDSLEPAVVSRPAPGEQKSSAAPQSTQSGDPGYSPGSSAVVAADRQSLDDQPELVLRLLRRQSGNVVLLSRVRSIVHLAMNSDGYLETLRGKGTQWMLNFRYFSGGSTILGSVDSTCVPTIEFISQREMLVTACAASGGLKLTAMATDGHRLWEDMTSGASIWPLMVWSPDGSRMARETLAVSHSISVFAPLDSDDVKGQMVRVFNAADGTVALETTAKPVLDGGGNVAISPSGRRVAVLNAGAIQIFELPEAPALPAAAPVADRKQSGR